MEHIHKEVDFHKYCPLCKYRDAKDVKDPCNECLGNPANVHSQKPINFKEVKK